MSLKCPEVRWTRRCGSAPAAAPWRCQRPGRVRSGSLHAARTQRRSLRRPPAARSPVRSSVPASAVPAAAACAPRRGERTRRPDSTGGGRGRPGGGLRFHRSIWVLRPPPPPPERLRPPRPLHLLLQGLGAPCAARWRGFGLRQGAGPRPRGWIETLGPSAGPARGRSTLLLDR